MTFEPAVGEDVHHLDTFGVERLRDEMRPVAVQRLLLRAHERDAMLRGPADDPGDTVPEIARPGDPFITDMTTLVVQGGICRTPAELTPEVHVMDAPSLERGGKRVPVEVGVEATPGCRAHVGHGGDAVLRQQCQETFQGVVGMADGEDRVFRHVRRPAAAANRIR